MRKVLFLSAFCVLALPPLAGAQYYPLSRCTASYYGGVVCRPAPMPPNPYGPMPRRLRLKPLYR